MTQPESAAHAPRRIRWGLLIVLLIVALFILGGVLLLAGLASLFKGQAVSVKPDSTLVLALDEPLQERQPDPLMTELFRVHICSVYDVTSALERAGKDDRIKSLLIDVGAFSPGGLGKGQEIRQAVDRFRQSKKPVYAYFEFASTGGYYQASAADKIYAPPTANLLLYGPMATAPFLRGVLDKLRIEPQLYHIGKYKSYSETFTEKTMTEGQKEATDAVLDSIYNQMTGDLAKARKLSEEDVRAAMDVCFLWGEDLKKRGLVDDLWYRDQLDEELKKANGNKEKLRSVNIADYVRDRRIDLAKGAKKTVALVLASGGIVSGGEGSRAQFGQDENISSGSMVRLLRKLGEKEDISAVVLRVDSPGGSGLASDVIWRQMQVLRKTKPVVISMSDVAASGGYYIAMGSDGIVAQRGTITGSIGVVTGKFVIKGLLDYADYNEVTLKRGVNSDIFSAYTRFTPEQEQVIQKNMSDFYDVFVNKAAEGRKKSYQQIHEVAQGRIWSGEDALKLGLVDKLGGIPEAVELAKEKAKIPKDQAVRIQVYPKPKSFLDAFTQGKTDDLARVFGARDVPPELKALYREYQRIRPLASEPFVAYEPVTIGF
jgi:protease-4